MGVEYTFEDRPGYLLVRASGQEEGVPDDMAFATSVRDEALKRGYARVLMDTRQIRYLTNNETSIVLMLRAMADSMLETRLFSAVTHIGVLSPMGHEKDIDTAETIFRNRGLNVRYFYEDAKAEAWIQAD